MKKPQLITIILALLFTAGIYFFVPTVPKIRKKAVHTRQDFANSSDSPEKSTLTIDSILAIAKTKLTPVQAAYINNLENSIIRSNNQEKKRQVYHQLATFWADSIGIFEPYAWYTAEVARLENSEKSLNFAARQFLENLQTDEVPERRKWKALQAKELFERSLQINPANDSAKVGLGAVYLFGGISKMPMEGILKIREVADRDSGNVYAQMMLGKGSLLSGQYEKAINRFLTVCRLDPDNIDAILLLAEAYERTGKKKEAIAWYRKSLRLIKQPEIINAINERIEVLQ